MKVTIHRHIKVEGSFVKLAYKKLPDSFYVAGSSHFAHISRILSCEAASDGVAG